LISALVKAFGQLDDPRLQKLIGLSVAISGAVFVLAALAAWFLVGVLSGLSGWWDDAARILGLLGVIVVAWFTFPVLAAALAALFAEAVIAAVEARHYPGRPVARKIGLPEAIADGLKISFLALIGNLLVLPFLLIPPLYALIAYGLNGYLLGREYFEMPAFGRLDRPAAKALYAKHRARITLAGVVIAFLSTIPILNLIAPIIGIAFMVHIFESVVNLDQRRK
jgi:CysZ protein